MCRRISFAATTMNNETIIDLFKFVNVVPFLIRKVWAITNSRKTYVELFIQNECISNKK